MTTQNDDPFQLSRFVEAQAHVYPDVLAELNAGRKRTHWMWFVFPQIEGLGHSPTATFYAVKSVDETQAYLHHHLLGARLRECTEILLNLTGRSLSEILGYPDDLKFCSSMTLFDAVASDNRLFGKAIDRYCEGRRDEKTLVRLSRWPG
ncbi:MAG: DUF1810 domain-containing protein [Hahellaceae bacterium]|nr:DUF1810 domain-containing protein [Hahellaceae bacterium]MCP5169706.1 DUF1810 domain-containing protein [Hahellaceae bacterium]